MYVHQAFRIDHQQAFGMLKERAFGTLVTADADRRPNAVHIPFMTQELPDGGLRIELHAANI